MRAEEISVEQIHKIETYTANWFVDKLHESLTGPFPKSIHTFFHIDSLQKYLIDVSLVKSPLAMFKGKISD
jgi:hypothetical protein